MVYDSIHFDGDNKIHNNVDEYRDYDTLKKDIKNLNKINSINVNMLRKNHSLLYKKMGYNKKI